MGMILSNLKFNRSRYREISIDELKSFIHRDVNFNEVDFPVKIKMVLQEKNKSVRKLQQYLIGKFSKLELDNPLIKRALQLCEDKMEPLTTIAIIGRENCGKTMLASLLLNKEVELPSLEDDNTSIITKMVYTDRPMIKKIVCGKVQFSKEFSSETDLLSEYHKVIRSRIEKPERQYYKQLGDFIEAERKYHLKIKSSLIVIEIGFPSALLKQGIEIIDCPRFDCGQNICQPDMTILREMNPSLICYVYDYRNGFSMKDGKLLDNLNHALYWEQRQSVQYILIANKCDLMEEEDNNIFDALHNPHFYQIGAAESVRNYCHFHPEGLFDPGKYLNSVDNEQRLDLISFNKERILPVRPLATAILFYPEKKGVDLYVDMFADIQQLILENIYNLSYSFLIYVLYFVSASGICKQKAETIINELLEIISCKN